jgi:biotin carboxyl carrier protein
MDGSIYKVKRTELTGRKKTEKKEGDLNSPISGTVVTIKVKQGNQVKKDDVILVIEAMKMEYLIRAPYNGKVKKIYFKEKDQIEIGQLTAEIEKEEK